MNDYFEKLERKRNKLLIIFFVLLLACFIGYIFSFTSGKLYVSLIVGIVSAIVCVFYYYAYIFAKNKLLKLYKSISSGIFQEDTFIFDSFDGDTEHDGVELIRVKAKYADSDEDFERTLYFIKVLPVPPLKSGDRIEVKTYQNIIISIKD